MTKAQRRQYKADNRQRRALEVLLASKPDPRSRTSLRKRFEAAHDAWREAVGLPAMERFEEFTDPVPVLAESMRAAKACEPPASRDEARDSTQPERHLRRGGRKPWNLAAGSDHLPPGSVCAARARGPVVPPVGEHP
jgi:hypothetical protein